MIRRIILALVALLALTGCGQNFMPTVAEITTFEIVRVVGIDKSEDDPGHVEVTIIAERAEEAPEEGFGGVTHEIASATGPTAFEAMAKLRSKLDRKQTFGYVDYIIFGESAVRDDLTKYTDFPARYPEFRYSPKVFIARGGSAKDLIENTSSSDMFVVDSLDNFKSNVNNRSDVKLVRYIELMNMLGREDFATVLPAVEGREPEDEKLLDGDLPEKKIAAAGYAVIRDFKLAGYFDSDVTRGYNFLVNNVRSCAYSVPDGYGGMAGLDVLSAGTRVIPRFHGDTLTGVTYRIEVGANITERRSRGDIHTPEQLSQLSARLADSIEREAREVVDKSQEFGIDCFRLGDEIKMRHPYRWRKIEDDWREVYKNLDIEVVAVPNIRREYDLREPY